MKEKNLEKMTNFSETNEDDISINHEAIEVMRLLQIEDIFNSLHVECLITFHQDRPALQTFIDYEDEEEITFYILEHIVDIDSGDFILEAILPMSIQGDQALAADFCMRYNQACHSSTLYWEDGRYILRIIHKEYTVPSSKEDLTRFLSEVKQEYRRFYQFA